MRLARWIVSWLAPAPWRESLLGDLEEERGRRMGHRRGGLRLACGAAVVAFRLRRETWRTPAGARERPWTGLGGDVRTAARGLRATPGFTVAAVSVLALGVGATTAIFTVADVSLLRPLPFREPDRLVAFGEVDRDAAGATYRVGAAAPQNYRVWEAQLSTLAGLGAAQNIRLFTAADGREPERLRALRVTASLLDVLGVRPALGTGFTSHHEMEGRDRVVLLGDGLWRRRYGADPAIVGRTVTFESGSYEVLGILPPGFKFPVQLTQPTDVVLPLVRSAQQTIRDRSQTGRNYALQVVGRLRDEATFDQARAEFHRVYGSLEAAYPDWFEDMRGAVAPLHDTVVGRMRNWMVLLLGAVGCVLLIACANVANLLLARTSSRARDLMVRAALGASRWRLVRGALVESLLLAAAGLAAGVLVAQWGVAALAAAMPTTIPRVADLAIDARVLGFAALVAVVTGVSCGLLPAWLLTRRTQADALREGGRGGSAGRARQRARAVLVVVEVGLAVTLVVGAGLFAASFSRVLRVDLGIDIEPVLAVGVNPRITPGPRPDLSLARTQTMEATGRVMARLRALPGVEAVGAVGSGSPLSGSWRTNAITVPGRPEFADAADQVQIREVTPEYADVVRLRLREGRFVSRDDRAGAPPVVVLNEEAVRRFFGGRSPIGMDVKLDEAFWTVVGVVGDVRPQGPEVAVAPEAYFPLSQRPTVGTTVVVRALGDPGALLPEARAAVLQEVPDVPVTAETMRATFREMTAQRRFNMLLVGLFGVLALAIAALGVYGVMAYLVTQQTREIGVRLALGAQRTTVLLFVLARAGAYTAAGLSLGLAAAWALGGTLEAFLFDVRGRDPWVFAGAAVALALTALTAALVPALRAARIDPIVALRAE